MNFNRNNFNEADFNQKFEESKELTKLLSKEKERQRLQDLNTEELRKSIVELSTIEILIGIKDTWFELIDDLLQGKFNMETFTKDNRLFYIGVTIILIVILYFLFSIFNDDQENDKNKKIIKIYHIYSKDNTE